MLDLNLPERKEIWQYSKAANLDFALVVFHKNYSTGMHAHEYFEINIVTNGEGIHYVEDKKYEVKKGSVFIVPPFVRHGYRSEHELDVYNIVLDNSFFEHYRQEFETIPAFFYLFNIVNVEQKNYEYYYILQTVSDKFNEIELCIKKLFQIQNNICDSDTINENRIIKNAYLMLIITYICQYYSEGFSSNAALLKRDLYYKFAKSVYMIYLKYNEKITVSMLADYTNMSYSAYAKFFKENMGCSPGQFINKHRIYKAKNLLAETNMSVAAIAQEVGFFDHSHFIKTFFSLEKISPTDYRKKLKNI